VRFSTKGRYAIRALMDLALFYDRSPVNLHSISERQDVSADYLEQILRKLRDAGLVRSVRGPRGGFQLARHPREITAWDVICALGETAAPAPCVKQVKKPAKNCERAPHCAARLMWEKLAKEIEAFLKKRTLQQLCDDARDMCCQASPEHKHMFHI